MTSRDGASRRPLRSRAVALTLAGLVAAALSLAVILGWATREAADSVARIGGPFVLVDVDGAPFDSARLLGRPHAVYFGYTHCPDVCPTALLDLTQALKTMGGEAEQVAIVFITVDPPRDPPEVMKSYVETVNPAIIGLTGSEEQIATVAKAFRVTYRAGPNDGGAYAVDHTALTYLFDRQGRYVTAIPSADSQTGMIAKLRRVLAAP